MEARQADVIVAGGGIAGLLVAAKLSFADPKLRIVILEKEALLGGRLRTGTSRDDTRTSYGLNSLAEPLSQEWSGILQQIGASSELRTLWPESRQRTFGVLSGTKYSLAPLNLWLKAKGAKLLGGQAAARQWADVDAIVKTHFDHIAAAVEGLKLEGNTVEASEPSDVKDDSSLQQAPNVPDKAFAQYWKKQRKAPAAIVLEHFCAAMGIVDLWNSTPKALADRAYFLQQEPICGDFSTALQKTIEHDYFKDKVAVELQCRIVEAKRLDPVGEDPGGWELKSEHGIFQAARLIVAQPPWQAITWLPRDQCPPSILSILGKTKPVSAVVLAGRIKSTAQDLPQLTLVPAERVQVINNSPEDICFQATIDFEMSLQAPAVVKAVRSLKRARKKFCAAFEGLELEGERISLQPVAWSQSPLERDVKWLKRWSKKPEQSPDLTFCGDAYGDSYHGDVNVISSVSQVIDLFN